MYLEGCLSVRFPFGSSPREALGASISALPACPLGSFHRVLGGQSWEGQCRGVLGLPTWSCQGLLSAKRQTCPGGDLITKCEPKQGWRAPGPLTRSQAFELRGWRLCQTLPPSSSGVLCAGASLPPGSPEMQARRAASADPQGVNTRTAADFRPAGITPDAGAHSQLPAAGWPAPAASRGPSAAF